MKTKMLKKIITILLTFIVILILLDITIRLIYCTDLYLSFDSSEFNNIATPLISLLGFVGICITILLSFRQVKSDDSEKYYEYYKGVFDNYDYSSGNKTTYKDFELIDFSNKVGNYYCELMKDNIYVLDMHKFKESEVDVLSVGKTYYPTLKSMMYFRIEAQLLFTDILRLLKEIINHKGINELHRELLLDKLISEVIVKYISGCQYIKERRTQLLKELYIGFDTGNKKYKKEQLKFFNQQFFQLYDFVMSNNNLRKYYDRFNAR